MSAKKKNPLKDLGAFLAHQEEQSHVPEPKKLSDATEEFMGKKPTQITKVGRPSKITVSPEVNAESITTLLAELCKKNQEGFRADFYQIIIDTIGQLDESKPEDKMLINTAIYLSNQDNWKDAVAAYWESR